jgi:hypothetical protein
MRSSRRVRAPGALLRSLHGRGAGVRWGLLAAAAVLLLLGPLAGSSSAATNPPPAPGSVPGLASIGGGAVLSSVDIFYQQVNHQLIVVRGTAKTNLGGVLTSGPTGVAQSPTEFVEEAVYARGTDRAIWYRQYSDGLGEWLPWAKLGGQALGAPSATCVGARSAPQLVYVRGLNSALWRTSGGGSWTSLGGVLASDPWAVPALNGACTSRQDVFALGGDRAVWEWIGGTWRRVGGVSTVAPAAVTLASGQTDLFVRGTDAALWMSTRVAGGSTWSAFHRVGGVLTSPPAATIFPVSPQTRAIFGLGGDGNLWRGTNVVGSSAWTWTQVP